MYSFLLDWKSNKWRPVESDRRSAKRFDVLGQELMEPNSFVKVKAVVFSRWLLQS
jgi:hypothetical protein